MIFNKKRAQGLPLNTIVIALLVVVVLVVIVLAFTTNIGNFNNQVSETGGGQCNAGNPAIATIYGSNVDTNGENTASQGCPDNYRRVPGVGGDPDTNDSICCVLPGEGEDGEDNTVEPDPSNPSSTPNSD